MISIRLLHNFLARWKKSYCRITLTALSRALFSCTTKTAIPGSRCDRHCCSSRYWNWRGKTWASPIPLFSRFPARCSAWNHISYRYQLNISGLRFNCRIIYLLIILFSNSSWYTSTLAHACAIWFRVISVKRGSISTIASISFLSVFTSLSCMLYLETKYYT